jgi:hypothetical protein
MQNKFEFQLIEGLFLPEEAGKVVLTLINDKIKYHALENFSDKIRFDSDNNHSKERIKDLNQASDSLKELIEFAKQNNRQLRINSRIEIVLE